MLRLLARAALLLGLAVPVAAQVPSAPGVPPHGPVLAPIDPLHQAGKNVTISLLTMGNGEQVWELFGHSAIWIHDNTSGRDTVFNWGVFDMHAPNFILHFLEGLNIYRMAGDPLQNVLYYYRYFNRSVVSQELALSDAQKDSLLRLIQINAQPENIEYRYDYFVDNCATKPRDLLDRVLGGQLHAHTNQLSGTSYRWHTIRLMQGDKPIDVGVDIGLGEPSDREITQWQEMFLPKMLHDYVATLQVRDSTGATHPLVRNETVLFQSTRPPEPAAPPPLGIWLLSIGIIVGLVLTLAGWMGYERGGARIAGAIVIGLWCLVAGLLGVVLTLLWTVTDHRFAYSNENLLLFNPLWLVLAVLVIVFYTTGRAEAWTRWLAITLAGLGVLALLAHVVGLSRQVNLPVIGLALPPALAIAGMLWLRRRSPVATAIAAPEHVVDTRQPARAR